MLRTKILIPLVMICILTMCGCETGRASVSVSGENEASENVYTVALPGEYDSADTAMVTKVSELTNSITFSNYELNKSYTLTYDSATKFTDMYGLAIAAGQLKQGSLVDIKFLKSGKLLTDLTESSQAFYLESITGFEVDTSAKVFKYKSDRYKIDDHTLVLDNNRKIALEDLSSKDTVTVMGVDNVIYSICLNSSHGYLKLKGADRFVGGTLEIGLKQIENITEDFYLDLGVGIYDITVVKGKNNFSTTITIEKDKETTLDLTGYVLDEEKRGYVYFDTTPDSAKVYVDGQVINNSKLIELPLGIHKLEAKAEGYEDFSRTFNVGEGKATLDVTLTEIEKEEEDTSTDSANTAGYYVFITSPTGVEVTVDGNYIGLTPLSFEKKAGNHTIALRKNGCVSRTYNVTLENTAKDVYYTFEELAADTSVSTNDTSGQ